MQSETRIATTNASTYIRQLCKHFSHKVQAEYTDTTGHIQFDGGFCDMTAELDTLVMRVVADNPERVPMLQSVMDRHLEKFTLAQKETLALGDWKVLA